MSDVKKVYYNFRCRKCCQVIAVYDDYTVTSIKAATFPNTVHTKCSLGIQNDEKVYADLVSYSDTPIHNTVEIITSDYKHLPWPPKGGE